jgi:uncharacterized repeat protein (TIGR03803 family)
MRAPGLGKTFCIGILFWVASAGALSAQTYTTLWTFIPSEGNGPAGGGSLIQGLNGELIGQTGLGGSFNDGTLFEMVPNGRVLSSLNFGGGCGPNCTAVQPIGSLLQAPNGTLYGVTNTGGAYVNGTVYQFTGSEGVSILHSFCPQLGCADGTYPTGGLVLGFTGKLYGMMSAGGTGAACPREFDPLGCGTIFEITPAGTFTTLYSFCSRAGCTDGASPAWALVLSTNGKFYGTAENGGVGNSDCVSYGCGTIFEISAAGTLTTLHRFCTSTNSNGFCTDGEAPSNGVIQGADGNFYGTTKRGGANGGGTIFKITPQGTLTTLYNFCSEANCLDGENPYAGLVQATDGNFYGTTTAGVPIATGFASGHAVRSSRSHRLVSTPSSTISALKQTVPTDQPPPAHCCRVLTENFSELRFKGAIQAAISAAAPFLAWPRDSVHSCARIPDSAKRVAGLTS